MFWRMTTELKAILRPSPERLGNTARKHAVSRSSMSGIFDLFDLVVEWGASLRE